MIKKATLALLSLISLAAFAPLGLRAQYEYLGTLDYNNLALNRVGNIPGMTWVSGSATYDQNNQRYFFQGSLTRSGPFQLYTINALTAAIIYNPLCPPAATGGQVYGLEYDGGTDTLYAMYYDGSGGAFFSWIDPSTGTVNVKNSVPGYMGFSESTYDTKDNIYIVNSGNNLLGIAAGTGAIVFNLANAAISNIQYDNNTGKLYGLNNSSGLPVPEFDSVSLSSGTVYPIAGLPAIMGFPGTYTTTVDENAGKYIFMGEFSTVSGCISDTLYSLDVNTGAVSSREYFTYGQGVNVNDENVIDFCFDNKRRTLYALNWYPPQVTPVVSVTYSPNPTCSGSLITFTASANPTFTNPSYQWQVNGVNAGSNSVTFMSSTLLSGDAVRCIVANSPPCKLVTEDTSNSVSIVFKLPDPASVSITSSADSVCAGQQVVFTAHTVNSGALPTYLWQLNGNAVGTDNPVYSTATLSNGDLVRCIIITHAACVLPGPDTSNVLVAQVRQVNSSLSIAASAGNICSGNAVTFTASATNGGTSPRYQWQVNGTATGTNNNVLISSSLVNGDIINCILQSSLACTVPVASNSITMIVNSLPAISFNPDTIVIKAGGTAQLNPVVSGHITSYRWSPATGLDNPGIMSPVANPSVTIVYQLTVISDEGCPSTGKETVLVYFPLEMPSAFTPNGDGKNDVFRIPPSAPQQVQSFAVFNRWGERVFSTRDSGAGWDGNFKGQPQPVGTYIWMIKYKDLLTEKSTIGKGTFVLIR